MRQIKHILKWCALLTKRLYKKPTFLVILILIPLLVVGYNVVAQKDSGIITIALAREDDSPIAIETIESLTMKKSVIRFVVCDEPDAAREMVKQRKADAAWVFRDNLEERIYKFVARPSSWNAFIRVTERESSVPLMLTREKLSGAVFDHCSRAMYLNYIRKNVPELNTMSDEALLEHYEAVVVDEQLFEFAYMDDTASTEDGQSTNYLLTPVRGLLAVVIMLCGLATAMYYIRDEELGTFALVPENRRALVEFGCQMISIVNVSVVVMISLKAAGVAGAMGRELILMLGYMVCVALFSMLIRRLLQSLQAVGTMLPLMIVLMLVLCPVFFDFAKLKLLQYLFPPTYFINGAFSGRFAVLMVLYALITAGLYYLAGRLMKRK